MAADDLQNTPTAINLGEGTYQVVVVDANNCSATIDVAVGEAPELTVGTDFTPISCQGGPDGTATALPGGGTGPYSYAWSNNQITQTATTLGAGMYTVTVLFEGGCSVTKSINVVIALLSAPTLNSSCGQDICLGSSCMLIGTDFNPTPDAYIWEAIPLAGSGMPLDTDNNEIMVNLKLFFYFLDNYCD